MAAAVAATSRSLGISKQHRVGQSGPCQHVSVDTSHVEQRYTCMWDPSSLLAKKRREWSIPVCNHLLLLQGLIVQEALHLHKRPVPDALSSTWVAVPHLRRPSA